MNFDPRVVTLLIAGGVALLFWVGALLLWFFRNIKMGAASKSRSDAQEFSGSKYYNSYSAEARGHERGANEAAKAAKVAVAVASIATIIFFLALYFA